MKFLVSGAGGDIGQSISRILSSYFKECEVIGSDIHAEFLIGDLFVCTAILPRASSPDYVDCLSELIDKEDINVFIPTSEPELRWFVEHHHIWERLSCHCLMANPMAMRIGFDKLLTVQHLQKSGLPSPWASIASESESGAPEIPCILKSRYGAGSSSVYLIDDQDKSFHYQTLFPDYIWQQYLPLSKGEFTCAVYRCLDGRSRVIVMRRRLSSGVTSFAEVVNDSSIESLCVQIADSLKLFGSINIQLRYIEGVGPMVFEINPRFSSTVGMRHKIGFSDLIWSIEEQFFERPASAWEICRKNIKLGRRYEEFISHD